MERSVPEINYFFPLGLCGSKTNKHDCQINYFKSYVDTSKLTQQLLMANWTAMTNAVTVLPKKTVKCMLMSDANTGLLCQRLSF